MSQKFKSPLRLTATLFSGLVLLGIAGKAIARPLQVETPSARPTLPSRPVQIETPSAQPAVPDGPFQFQTANSIVGDWQGLMHSAGDDVGAYLHLSIPAGNAPAVWQHMGAEYVNDQWVDAVLAQGTLTKTVQGDQVTLMLHNFYGKTLQLQGSFQNGGQQISGHVAGEPNLVFGLNK